MPFPLIVVLAHIIPDRCLAMMVSYWVEQMDADARKLEEARLEDALEAELRTFVEHAGGISLPKKSWVDW
ncbi:hypothetical protein MNKW57_12910 [Biformimicrobium ophioploci]|uniref:Uncharacterized protein n=1 Tax=Biformimicrobium ophioploci TaxID=3036711 RepID=A0ABQ6LY10_9GAMM|nr:hypothetical protein MNKW57_12910 [Microbulbifer sp. NKW57]